MLEIAGGIVLAVLILLCWRVLLVGALVLGAGVLVLGVVSALPPRPSPPPVVRPRPDPPLCRRWVSEGVRYASNECLR